MEESIEIINVISNLSTNLTELVKAYPWVSSLMSALLAGFVGTGVFTFKRRIREPEQHLGEYFTDSELLSPPMKRPAYSDRMAYVLAEMSDLAYYKFEGDQGLISDAVNSGISAGLDKAENITKFLEDFSLRLLGDRELGKNFLEKLLKKSNFELLDTIHVVETQGFACKYNVPDEPSYIVIAFRGTEKKISDWLTDADAEVKDLETPEGSKVHTGFWKAFCGNKDENNKSVKDLVVEILDMPEAKDQSGKSLPVFICGHSLGGALALMATRLAAHDIDGACYTFGAPRIANYEFYKNMKTPVYRIVNSSDVVPRVPPGAGMILLLSLVRGLGWITSFIPKVSSIFDWIEKKLDKLNGYRHFGDLRYLTDIPAGVFDKVKLLSNPPAIDRTIWMWKSLVYSISSPLKNHSMSIYRKKLKFIANDRN